MIAAGIIARDHHFGGVATQPCLGTPRCPVDFDCDDEVVRSDDGAEILHIPVSHPKRTGIETAPFSLIGSRLRAFREPDNDIVEELSPENLGHHLGCRNVRDEGARAASDILPEIIDHVWIVP